MTANTLQRNHKSTVQAAGSSDRLRQIAVVVATVSTIVINVLANLVPFNNQGTGEISDRLQHYFVPAGYVFSIWGVIYIGILAYAVFQARDDQGALPWQRSIGLWYLVGSVANSVWIFLWHWNQLGLSAIVIIVLLVSLLAIYLQMQRLGWETGKRSGAETWCVFIPFSIYLAWGSVATVANISAWLWQIQWSGFGLAQEPWAEIMLLVAGVLGIFFAWRRRNLAYAAVLVWALVGIAVKQAAAQPVAITAWIMAAAVLAAAIAGAALRMRATAGEVK